MNVRRFRECMVGFCVGFVRDVCLWGGGGVMCVICVLICFVGVIGVWWRSGLCIMLLFSVRCALWWM